MMDVAHGLDRKINATLFSVGIGGCIIFIKGYCMVMVTVCI